jgi:phosphatidylserine/phosphatidylglycerophosphate/cardiolipin synthase-like enzyme
LIKSLYQAGIEVFCYQATGLLPPFPRTFPSIMHHKFLVFEDVQGLALVACGSLNYTNAGFNGNQEQMQIRTNHAGAFLNHFGVLKERSYKVDQDIFLKIVKSKFMEFALRSMKRMVR